jgi:AhpD family alkylhydroperoxidase
MASHRVQRRHKLDEGEIERRRAADNETDREYTTPERLAALRGEPILSPPGVEDEGLLEALARDSSPAGATSRGRRAPTLEADFDAEVEERIREEIDDFEREGSCAPRGAQNEPPAVRAVPTLEGAAEPASGGERALSRRPEERAKARSGARRGSERPRSVRRIDFRAAAPEAFTAMSRLEAYVRHCGLERALLDLVELRASQLNGCEYCIDMRLRYARRAEETERRLHALEAWKETRAFTNRERAALAWTEAVTHLGPDRVSDQTFRIAREHFSEAELVNLTVAIIAINGWNRLAIAFRAERRLHHSLEGPSSHGA